jgi:O-antigen ligase
VPLTIVAGRVIQDHPFTGVGANNFALVQRQYWTSEFVGEWFFVAHNKYLLVLAETGPGALLSFVVFLLATLRRGWRVWQRDDPYLAPLALCFTAVVVGHMEHMALDVFHSRPQVQTLWLISALILAMSHIPTESRDAV